MYYNIIVFALGVRSLYGLSMLYVTHVTLDTRPSRFSRACNVEKLGVAGLACEASEKPQPLLP